MLLQIRLQELARSINRSALGEPAAVLGKYARKETSDQERGRERRRDRRYSLITNVVVIPVDEKLQTVGQPFVALSSGMSVSGIRLIHNHPSPSDLLFLEIDGQPVQFLLTVLRNRPTGPCFEIAGRLRTVEATTNGVMAFIPFDEPSRNVVEPGSEELIQWAGVTAAVSEISKRVRNPL